MEVDTKIKAYRFVGYAAVTFSAVAVFSICVTLPMVYNYVHSVRRQMNAELALCKGSAKGVWTDIYAFREQPAGNRTARQTVFQVSLLSLSPSQAKTDSLLSLSI